jgi:hypothetical protein
VDDSEGKVDLEIIDEDLLNS